MSVNPLTSPHPLASCGHQPQWLALLHCPDVTWLHLTILLHANAISVVTIMLVGTRS